MQGAPARSFPSPQSPPSSSSRRRVQNDANAFANKTSGTSGPVLRSTPRKLQSLYITADGAGNAARSPSFSTQPSRRGARNEACMEDSDGEASSPPLDEPDGPNQPEAITTAAAYNSPMLFSSKLAQKRFNTGALYAESDHPYEDDSDNHVASSIERYRTPRIRPKIYENGYSATTKRTSQGVRANSTRHTFSRVLELLPFRIQRLFNKRRKKILSPELHIEPHREQASRRPTLLFLLSCVVIAGLVYLVFPSDQAAQTAGDLVQEDTSSDAQHIQKPSLPARKWWEASPDPAVQKKRKAKKKATSFARPYHTLDELLGLPSRFNSTSDVSLNEPIQAFPSLTVLIDCVNTDYPLGGARKSSLNSVLETLWSQKIQPSSICVLVSPDNYPRTNPSLFGYSEGTTKIYTLSGYDEEFVLKTPFSTIQSEYVLLLECPPLQEYKQPTVNDTDFLVKTVRIAGTDQYSSSALTFSGLARSPLQFESSGFIAYGNQPVPDGYLHDENSEVIYHELKESRQVAVPHGALLLQSNWLNGLREGVDIQARGALKMVTRGLVETIGRRLNDQLHIKTWALPISGFSLYDNAVRSELLDLAKRLPQDYLRPSNNDEHRDATLGSSAKVAILLSERDLEYAQAWESITCGFADETIYGHEVRLYTDLSEAETHPVILGCPEVEVLPLRPSLIQAWQPDVCLTTMQMQIDDMMVGLSALHIEIPDTDLIHVDWLVALPLESLLTHYLGDNVNLLLNLEQTVDDSTRDILEASHWPLGNIFMRHRVVLGGLMTSIVESWYPVDNHTYGVLLEDDVEVSPLFYSWLKFSILYYRYGTEEMRRKAQRLYGVSLYQPKNIELRPEGRRKFDAHKLLEEVGIPSTLPYLSQIPCSWGAAYFPEHWREFHHFLSIRLSEATLDLSDPIVPNIRSNRWPNSWKRYLIELVYLKGYSMLYPNYQDFRSLSTNHLEQGTHVKDELQAQKRRDLFEVPLLSDEDNLVEELPDGRLPSWSAMPVIDFWGSLVNEKEIIDRGQITFDELDLCPDQGIREVADGSAGSKSTSVQKLSHDASRLLCTGPMDEQDWKEWRIRMQRGGNEIDARMLLEREARLDEREERLAELEKELVRLYRAV